LEPRKAARRGLSKRNSRRRPTLPGGCPPSTIGASGLNFSVRNGKRCTPAAITAETVKGRADARPSKLHSSDNAFKIKTSGNEYGSAEHIAVLARPAYRRGGLPRPLLPLGDGKPHLEVGFPLRCFQRLSHPDVANQQRRWHDD